LYLVTLDAGWFLLELVNHEQRVNKKQKLPTPRVNKEQDVQIDSAAWSGGQGKYLKYVDFPWFPAEVALFILILAFLF